MKAVGLATVWYEWHPGDDSKGGVAGITARMLRLAGTRGFAMAADRMGSRAKPRGNLILSTGDLWAAHAECMHHSYVK